jgi:hypothetical protein
MSLLNDQSPGGLLEKLASKKPSKAAGLGGPTAAVRPLWDSGHLAQRHLGDPRGLGYASLHTVATRDS